MSDNPWRTTAHLKLELWVCYSTLVEYRLTLLHVLWDYRHTVAKVAVAQRLCVVVLPFDIVDHACWASILGRQWSNEHAREDKQDGETRWRNNQSARVSHRPCGCEGPHTWGAGGLSLVVVVLIVAEAGVGY